MASSGTEGDGGGAVAQPRRSWASVDAASIALFGMGTLGLAIWAAQKVLEAGGGQLGAPLDDSYIHFQFARSFARFHPLEYVPGQPPVPGATSLLWPALLAPAIWLGASGGSLIAVTWVLGFLALFGQASEVYLAARRFLSQPFALLAGVLVLSLSANTWFAASAMEVVPLGYLLLRSARRAAEFYEGQRSPRRRNELLLLAFATALLRPEGLLAALCVAAAFALSGKAWLRYGAVTLTAPLLAPLFNLLWCGTATSTTTTAKWLPLNPYYGDQLWPAVLRNWEIFYGTLLDGREWSWTFIPEGYRLVAYASLPALFLAAERRGARLLGGCLWLVGLGILIPTTYETFLVNRLRYLWPFSAPWLLGVAALGELVALPLGRVRPKLALLGLVVPLLAAWGFARLAPISVGDLAQSAAAITAQQVSLGRWAAEHLPADARVGVNDTGAISYYSGRTTFDIVGLTTRNEARYWVGGVGSRFEHYERLLPSERPTHFIVYPGWFGLPQLLGECLTERRVEGATILGGPLMVACRANYESLGSGTLPTLDVGKRALVDELDVADLDSEQQHAYELRGTSQADNVIESLGKRFDAGRTNRSLERFRIRVEPDGLLVVRLSNARRTQLILGLAGRERLATIPLEAGPFQEVATPIPRSIGSGPIELFVHARGVVTSLHYWSFGRVL
jgi:hypothetical protein